MALETALSRPVQLDRCEGIVREALLGRRAELRKSWRRLISSESLESMSSVAKELLRQLMVPDRAKLEAGDEFDVDMVLLKLNLVGIRAMITRDLRFLDALNYFYELPRRSLARMRTSPRFLASWLCVYAQLLS